jgi:hypothetical protein
MGSGNRLNRGLREAGARVLTPLGNRSSIVSFAVDPARENRAIAGLVRYGNARNGSIKGPDLRPE